MNLTNTDITYKSSAVFKEYLADLNLESFIINENKIYDEGIYAICFALLKRHWDK
jgi:hypothetical protein